MPLLGGKNKAKAEPARIRIEKVVLPVKPKPKPLAGAGGASSSKASPRPSPLASARAQSLSPYPSSSDDRRPERKRKAGEAAPRKSPAVEIKFDNDSDAEDGDDDWISALDARKRQRKTLENGRLIDMNRLLRNPKSFGEPESERELQMVHAVQVASLKEKCVPVLGAAANEVAVELQYPSLFKPEQFELVYGKDQIDAVKQIIKVVRHVAETYLTDEQAKPFTDANYGLIRRLEKASNRNVQDLQAFKAALAEYNQQILALVKDGTIGANLDKNHELPRSLVAFMLLQVYDRTVAPKVELLRQYENGTDNVYGELLHPFVSDILVEKTKMTSDQVFVDLGSGVGNVVLQAALEIGCETWGCEMMENACNLADEQQREFAARCKLWGVASGKVHLERGDFRKNEQIHEALKRADVVLVNNQAFTSQLNDDLVRMFLDLKTGCKIVSLKTFVHDHKSASHNINDVGNTILDVEELTYPQGYVSWTGAGGTYCISTRK